MKKLTKILLATSILFTTGCGERPNSRVLKEENFEKAEWIKAPYHGEIWNSYVGEEIARLNTNWRIYKEMVAEKNDFGYVERNGKTYIIGFRRKIILLPNLDGDSTVISGKDTIRSKAKSSSP